MESRTTKIRNGTIPLPKALQGAWKNARIYISAGSDTIVVKRLSRPTLASLGPKLRQIGKRITVREIEAEVWAARRKIA